MHLDGLMVRRLAAALLLSFGLVISSGGAKDPSSLPWRIKNAQQATVGQSLVVGTIRYIRDGEEKKCADGGYKCVAIILPPDGNKASVYEFERSTDFVWSLPPGQYTILAFARRDSGWNIQSMRAIFTVPDDLTPTYIGELVFEQSDGRYTVGAGDDFEREALQFEANYPSVTQKLSRGLVSPEPRPGTWLKMSGICAPDWKIGCTKNYWGVTPLLPSDGKKFASVDGLSPQFRWTPSADSTVTYDIVLYEAASFNDDGITRQFTEGRLVDYSQGLAEPQWTPNVALEPNRKYYWSVRARRKETVSTWSSYSYFNFFLIGFSSGYGQWFKFATPAASKSR